MKRMLLEHKFRGNIHYEMLLDEKHHVIMDWTPKAACSKSVEMFWNVMGITRGKYYGSSLVHDYRKDFYAQCGYINQEMVDSSNYYKFKVVRNPYDRAVSSYIHLMNTLIGHLLMFGLRGDEPISEAELRNNNTQAVSHPWNDLSFEELLDLYINEVLPARRRAKGIRNIAIIHIEPQSSDAEAIAFKSHEKSIFDHIVHLETFEEDIAVVNEATKLNYSYPEGFDSHVAVKSDKLTGYVGDMPFHYLKEHGIPGNYGMFYNEKTKLLVEQLFANDLEIYGYTFPFGKVF